MIEFDNTIVIERPVEEVFAFISHFENLPKWNYFVTRVDKLTDGPVAMGTVYQQTRKTDEQRLQVVEYRPNERVAIETLPPERRLRMEFRFGPADNGNQTHIVDAWELESDAPGPLAWLATRRVKAAVAENLDKLKALLETGEVTLQDGRTERIADRKVR